MLSVPSGAPRKLISMDLTDENIVTWAVVALLGLLLISLVRRLAAQHAATRRLRAENARFLRVLARVFDGQR
jgi:hypothetical protein